uniref:Uncharacterized protein n=1 Tax=Timema poppense TaxID=170557 RepID=A0A7R9DED2_TIMPO|nr:unnamed protein product [Timema poppensis]
MFDAPKGVATNNERCQQLIRKLVRAQSKASRLAAKTESTFTLEQRLSFPKRYTQLTIGKKIEKVNQMKSLGVDLHCAHTSSHNAKLEGWCVSDKNHNYVIKVMEIVSKDGCVRGSSPGARADPHPQKIKKSDMSLRSINRSGPTRRTVLPRASGALEHV